MSAERSRLNTFYFILYMDRALVYALLLLIRLYERKKESRDRKTQHQPCLPLAQKLYRASSPLSLFFSFFFLYFVKARHPSYTLQPLQACGVPSRKPTLAKCVITRIFDQSDNNNFLHVVGQPDGLEPVATGGRLYKQGATTGTNASADPLRVDGHAVYSAYFEGGMGFRTNVTKNVPTGDEPETIYMVTSGTHYGSNCCFDYGNAEIGTCKCWRCSAVHTVVCKQVLATFLLYIYIYICGGLYFFFFYVTYSHHNHTPTAPHYNKGQTLPTTSVTLGG